MKFSSFLLPYAGILSNVLVAATAVDTATTAETCPMSEVKSACPNLNFDFHQMNNGINPTYKMDLEKVQYLSGDAYQITVRFYASENIPLSNLHSLKVREIQGPKRVVQLWGKNEGITPSNFNPSDFTTTFIVYGDTTKDPCYVWLPTFQVQYEYIKTEQWEQNHWGDITFDLFLGCSSDNQGNANADFPLYYWPKQCGNSCSSSSSSTSLVASSTHSTSAALAAGSAHASGESVSHSSTTSPVASSTHSTSAALAAGSAHASGESVSHSSTTSPVASSTHSTSAALVAGSAHASGKSLGSASIHTSGSSYSPASGLSTSKSSSSFLSYSVSPSPSLFPSSSLVQTKNISSRSNSPYSHFSTVISQSESHIFASSSVNTTTMKFLPSTRITTICDENNVCRVTTETKTTVAEKTETITTCDENRYSKATNSYETITKEFTTIAGTVTKVITYCGEHISCKPVTTVFTTVCPATLSTYTSVVSKKPNGEQCSPYTTTMVTPVPLESVTPSLETETMTTVVSTKPNGEPCSPYTTTIVTTVPAKPESHSLETETTTTVVSTKPNGEPCSPYTTTLITTVPIKPDSYSLETETITTVVSTKPNGEPCSPYTTTMALSTEESMHSTITFLSEIHASTAEKTTPSAGLSTASVKVKFEGKGATVKNSLVLTLLSVLFLI